MYKAMIHTLGPSLNTQSCIKGLLGVRGIYFWSVWAAGPVLKKKGWANYKQLFRAVFLCFHEQKRYFFKHCSIRTKKLHNNSFLKIF